MAEVTTSKKYSLNWRDLLKGALLAGLTYLTGTLGQMGEQWLMAWATDTVFHPDKISLVLSLKAAVGAFVGYLIKNFFSPSQIVITPQKEDVAPKAN